MTARALALAALFLLGAAPALHAVPAGAAAAVPAPAAAAAVPAPAAAADVATPAAADAAAADAAATPAADAVATTAGDDAAAATPADSTQLFVGTWMLLNTPAQAEIPPFYELITFHADGTVVQTESDLTGPPFPATVGHGVWRRVSGPGLVLNYTVVHLVYDPTTFLPLGTIKVVGRGVLGKDGNTFSGQVKATVYDLHGAVLFQGNGPFAGSRVENEPF